MMQTRSFGVFLSWAIGSMVAIACSSTGTGGGSGSTGTGGSSGSTGTGGGSGSTGTGGSSASTGSGDCEGACDKIAALPCGDRDGGTSACVSDCQAEVAPGAPCATEAQALVDCVSTATLSCNADGTPNTSTVCASQSRAYGVCAICLPDSTDTACDTCTKSTCCPEYKALAGDPALLDYANCLNACTDVACFDACQAQYPSVGQANTALVNCQAACPTC